MLALGLALRSGVAVIAEAIFAMEPVRVIMRAIKRFIRAGEDGDVGAADFGGEERVSGRLLRSTLPATVVRPSRRTLSSAKAMMIATASSEAVSVSMRKLRMRPAYLRDV